MALITIPSGLRITDSNFGLASTVQAFKSPFSSQQQVNETSPAVWMLEFTTALYRFDEANSIAMKSFMAKLRGGVNHFEYGDPDYVSRRGVGGGTPLVQGAGQTGSSIITDGWPINTTNIMRDGDYFTVNGELKRMTADVNSNASGVATLQFEPPTRVSPPDNAALNITNPKASFTVNNANVAVISSDYRRLTSFTVSAMERLPV